MVKYQGHGKQLLSLRFTLLFILFINDLPSVVHCCKIVLYANDTALFFADRNIQSALQEDLNAVGEWFSSNRL